MPESNKKPISKHTAKPAGKSGSVKSSPKTFVKPAEKTEEAQSPKKTSGKQSKPPPHKPLPKEPALSKEAKASPLLEPTAEAPPQTPPNVITMKPPIIVRDLADRMNLKPFQLVHELMEMNVFATLNQAIDEETAKRVCERKGFVFEQERREKGAGIHKEEKKTEIPEPEESKEDDLQIRPPVITFMGHVDHGKTSLLDAIRKTKVAAGEAGGITQHIGAYSIERNGKHITFLDTPGHEAFTAMRARGANVTDIAVIVVAADDGLMPQTREAIQHAQAANVTIMVAINKIDLPGANPIHVKSQLREIGLVPDDWGGHIVCCDVSAIKGDGIDHLIEMMLLQADIMELKANPKGPARCVVIESQIEPGRGPNATVIVKQGCLRAGVPCICGKHWGRIKALIGDDGKPLKQAGPSMPVKILGLSGSPQPGEELTVMPSDREARILADERAEEQRLGKLTAGQAVTLENFFDSLGEETRKTLGIVLKTDVQGSLEAIVDSLKKIPSEKIDLNFVLLGVGPVTINDIQLAKSTGAIVIGFNTKTENQASITAKREQVQIKLYSIIYELIDQVKEAMAGMLEPQLRESRLGTAKVKKVFRLSKFPVSGCVVENGRIVRNAQARVLRDGQPIYDGSVAALKRFQDDVNEVRSGVECGIRLGSFNEYLEGDVIECYTLEKIPQVL